MRCLTLQHWPDTLSFAVKASSYSKAVCVSFIPVVPITTTFVNIIFNFVNKLLFFVLSFLFFLNSKTLTSDNDHILSPEYQKIDR